MSRDSSAIAEKSPPGSGAPREYWIMLVAYVLSAAILLSSLMVFRSAFAELKEFSEAGALSRAALSSFQGNYRFGTDLRTLSICLYFVYFVMYAIVIGNLIYESGSVADGKYKSKLDAGWLMIPVIGWFFVFLSVKQIAEASAYWYTHKFSINFVYWSIVLFLLFQRVLGDHLYQLGTIPVSGPALRETVAEYEIGMGYYFGVTIVLVALNGIWFCWIFRFTEAIRKVSSTKFAETND